MNAKMPYGNEIMISKAEKLLTRVNISLIRHVACALYGPTLLLGKQVVSLSTTHGTTASTDGYNTYFYAPFILSKKIEELRFIRMHEAGHIFLKHLQRNKWAWKLDRELANASADFAINGLLKEICDKYPDFMVMPEGALYSDKFDNWSFEQIFRFLHAAKNQQPPPPEEGDDEQDGGGGGGGDPSDDGDKESDEDADDESDEEGDGEGDGEGDEEGDGDAEGDGEGDEDAGDDAGGEEGEGKDGGGKPNTITDEDGNTYSTATMDQHIEVELTPEERSQQDTQIDMAVRQGAQQAGRVGANVPRSLLDALEPKVDWRKVMAEFLTSAVRGREEYTYRRFNVRRMADDIYLPSTENDSIGEIVNGSDTSGSISQRQLSDQAGELCRCVETVMPEAVRQLWWDTEVCSEQLFMPEDYASIKDLLKPAGGGGTHAGCVPKYIKENNITPICVVMMTDGYTEQPIEWDLNVPTLWLVTDNRHFQPPAGHKMVMIEEGV